MIYYLNNILTEFSNHYPIFPIQSPISPLKQFQITLFFCFLIFFNNDEGWIMWYKILLIILTISTFIIADEIDNNTKILFIGSSYFNYNNLPDMVQRLSENGGKPIVIERKIRNGLFLSDHVADSNTETIINSQKWDFIILQGVGRNMAYPDYFIDHPEFPAIQSIMKMANKNHAETKIVYCLPWAFEDGMLWYQGWTDDYFAMQQKVTNTTMKYAEDLNFVVAPVGITWENVLSEFEFFPQHYLHMSDWNHPSVKGSYLMACTIYSTIFQESCVNIGYSSTLDDALAKHFQEVASTVVLDSLDKWNISSIDDIQLTPENFRLEQNYPNPFNSMTKIDYTLPLSSQVRIDLFDVLGRKVDNIINEYQIIGYHQIHYSNDNLKSGLYFYKLNIGKHSLQKKMMLVK